MNEPDAYALEEALRLKEKHGGEVVVCLGRAGARRAGACAKRWRAAPIARIHVEDDALAQRRRVRDRARRSRAAMKDEKLRPGPHRAAVRRPGLRADRRDPRRAARPAARDDHHGRRRSQGSRRLRVKRELEGGWFQWVAMPLPAVLTIQSGINQLRYATLKGIMAAKKKEIRKAVAAGGSGGAAEDRQPVRAEKAKKTQLIGGRRRKPRRSWCAGLREEARVIVQ